MKTIYTIGHSAHAIDHFIAVLRSFNIQLLADIRRYPVSKWHPQFTKQALEDALLQNGIVYTHFVDLGARLGTGSYSDHMQTDMFKTAVQQLQDHASTRAVAYMCAEADWRHCHRAKVSSYLVARHWYVQHITSTNRCEHHPVEAIYQGKLFQL